MQHLRARLTAHPTTAKIFTNIGWLFSDNMLRLVAGIVISAWVARYLGVSDYGKLKGAVTLLLIFQAAMRLGLDEVLLREFVRRPEARASLMASAWAMRVGLSVLVMPLTVGAMWLIKPNEGDLLWLTFILSFSLLFLSFEVFDYWFQSVLSAKYTVIVRNIALFSTASVRVLLILLGAPLWAFAVMIVLENAIFALGLLVMYVRKTASPWFRMPQMTHMRHLLRDGYPLIISGVAITAFMRIDQLMLVQMLPNDNYSVTVGLYAAAASLSEVWFFVPVSIVNSFLPSIIGAHKTDPSAYRLSVQRLFNGLALLSYAFSIGVTLLAGVIIRVLFGTDFLASIPLLIVLVWASVFISFSAAREIVLNTENKLRYAAYINVTGALVNILLNLLLIPQMGAMGSAIATLIAYVVVGYGGSFFVRTSIPVGWMQTRALIFPNPFSKH